MRFNPALNAGINIESFADSIKQARNINIIRKIFINSYKDLDKKIQEGIYGAFVPDDFNEKIRGDDYIRNYQFVYQICKDVIENEEITADDKFSIVEHILDLEFKAVMEATKGVAGSNRSASYIVKGKSLLEIADSNELLKELLERKRNNQKFFSEKVSSATRGAIAKPSVTPAQIAKNDKRWQIYVSKAASQAAVAAPVAAPAVAAPAIEASAPVAKGIMAYFPRAKVSAVNAAVKPESGIRAFFAPVPRAAAIATPPVAAAAAAPKEAYIIDLTKSDSRSSGGSTITDEIPCATSSVRAGSSASVEVLSFVRAESPTLSIEARSPQKRGRSADDENNHDHSSINHKTGAERSSNQSWASKFEQDSKKARTASACLSF